MTKQTAPRSRGAHRTDVLSLIFGLFFLAIAGWWAADHYLDVDWPDRWARWDLPNLGWFVAGGLILVGLAGVIASLRRDRSGDAGSDAPADVLGEESTEPADPVHPGRSE